MLTGRRFWTVAMVLCLCVLVTAGCRRRRSSRGSTITNNEIFTTDNFPGNSVQDGNVSDDKRAFSISGDSFNGGTLVCTHNGDTGTIMVTYRVDEQLFAHYYDGGEWSPGVALRHFDTFAGTTPAEEVVHAFLNTGDFGSSEAEDRDGDVLIFWTADDFDTDGAGTDETNHVLYVSYFDVSHAGDVELNYGFDIDPLDPGFYEAQRVSSLEFSGEDVIFTGLVSDGLCGEARWASDGNYEYQWGDATTAIFAFWHQLEEKATGEFDETTATSGFDLDFVVDDEFPVVPSSDVEIAIQTFGASDSGIDARESAVAREYASYNAVLFRRVRSDGDSELGNGTAGHADLAYESVVATGSADVTLQYTHFNLVSFVLTTDSVNTFDPDSDGVGDIDSSNSDFLRNNNGFVGCTGQGIYGRDEGLSCLVTFFNEAYDSNTDDLRDEDAESEFVLAEVDEDTGAFLNDAEVSLISIGDDITIVDNALQAWQSTRIGRNGDYIWMTWAMNDTLGTFDFINVYAEQYLTTRLDDDGNPVAIPLLGTTLGFPLLISDDVNDDYAPGPDWIMWQEQLGYICGLQSEAGEMNLFFESFIPSTADPLILHVRLVADVDGVVGGETASSPVIIVNEDNGAYHRQDLSFFLGVNEVRSTFNAIDAGQDGDILYVFKYDDNAVNGPLDNFISVGRLGVTSATPIELGSGTFTREVPHFFSDPAEPIVMVGTPPGENIGGFDLDDLDYDSQAHHGPEVVHILFQESENNSPPLSGSQTTSGFALRTRAYVTDNDGGTFGDDFVPNAGTDFAVPFDLDLPFVDPDTSDDAEIQDILVCEDRVAVIFLENERLYWQETGDSDGGDNDIPWRQSADGVSDPALIDDDTDIQIGFIEEICSPTCGCCTVDGTAIFWVKELDDSNNDERLQVRVVGDND